MLPSSSTSWTGRHGGWCTALGRSRLCRRTSRDCRRISFIARTRFRLMQTKLIVLWSTIMASRLTSGLLCDCMGARSQLPARRTNWPSKRKNCGRKCCRTSKSSAGWRECSSRSSSRRRRSSTSRGSTSRRSKCREHEVCMWDAPTSWTISFIPSTRSVGSSSSMWSISRSSHTHTSNVNRRYRNSSSSSSNSSRCNISSSCCKAWRSWRNRDTPHRTCSMSSSNEHLLPALLTVPSQRNPP
mmetsp:Transcript_57107/g.148662  ORF Transcript_57107/g.148662 Transcript_57107/m.148662 type:complete len:242 (+) Transcript_57107:432-1157(+)